MRLSKKIVQERADTLGITQRELALKLEITARTVNRWFSGGSQIPSKYEKKMRDEKMKIAREKRNSLAQA